MINTAWKVPLFSLIWTEYREILRISPYLIQMRENADQKNSEYRSFLRSEYSSDTNQFFHEGSPYHMENCALICSANQWNGFYMIRGLRHEGVNAPKAVAERTMQDACSELREDDNGIIDTTISCDES